jgi:coproporphyrinogen III oxidase-like Fe-S oxidoreductase
MARAMFEYTKEVLQRVSFDVQLFSKEVQKAVKRLLPYEVQELRIFVENLIKTNPELQPSLLYLTN